MKIAMFALAALLMGTVRVAAEVRLPTLLGTHMVLQREQPIHLWGWADPDERVTAEMEGKSSKARRLTRGDAGTSIFRLSAPAVPTG